MSRGRTPLDPSRRRVFVGAFARLPDEEQWERLADFRGEPCIARYRVTPKPSSLLGDAPDLRCTPLDTHLLRRQDFAMPWDQYRELCWHVYVSDDDTRFSDEIAPLEAALRLMDWIYRRVPCWPVPT